MQADLIGLFLGRDVKWCLNEAPGRLTNLARPAPRQAGSRRGWISRAIVPLPTLALGSTNDCWAALVTSPIGSSASFETLRSASA